MLFLETWAVLHNNQQIFKDKNISETIVNFAVLEREEALQRIPAGKQRPDQWKPDEQLMAKILSKYPYIK